MVPKGGAKTWLWSLTWRRHQPIVTSQRAEFWTIVEGTFFKMDASMLEINV